ncbi:MAG: hypothetical protein LJE68_18390 [Rhodobacter sp.]|nr:hypothetical protein [Rhodobacter sp.]
MSDTNATSAFESYAFRDAGPRWGSPICQFGLILLAVLSFKILLCLQMSAPGLAAVLTDLSGGSLVERLAARFLTLDAVSQMLVDALSAR